MTTLALSIDLAAYRHIAQAHPELIHGLETLLNLGQTARQIEDWLRHQFGPGRFTLQVIGAARFMAVTQKRKENHV